MIAYKRMVICTMATIIIAVAVPIFSRFAAVCSYILCAIGTSDIMIIQAIVANKSVCRFCCIFIQDPIVAVLAYPVIINSAFIADFFVVVCRYRFGCFYPFAAMVANDIQSI